MDEGKLMYKELIKRLRDAATMSEALAVLLPHSVGDATAKLYNEAVDAIESTSKAYQMMAEAYESEVTKHCWIPVTERLPEEYKNVLCYYEYFRYGNFNCMFRTIDRGYYGNGIWGGEAGQGHKNKVLAWMPLPEPPEEEI